MWSATAVPTKYYLFLDVDGVLHPASWGIPGITPEQAAAMPREDFHLQAALRGFVAQPVGVLFSQVPVFEAAIRPYLDEVEFVITSSWRLQPELYDQVLNAFSPDVRARVAGPLPLGRRPLGINVWLREHGKPGTAGIVIDDDESHEWRHLRNSTIVMFTVTERGFTEKDGQCLAKLLSLDPAAFAALVKTVPRECSAERLMDAIAGLAGAAPPPLKN